MTYNEACKLFGIDKDTPFSEIKKKYHTLMHRYHPDSAGMQADADGKSLNVDATLINEAYAILSRGKSKDTVKRKAKTPKQDSVTWKAAIFETAYEERNIYQTVEDSDGNTLGNICVATGKYVWTKDEDFSQFMMSIYDLSKSILDRIDSAKRKLQYIDREAYQAELAYLLARQFINGTEAMKFILGEGTLDDNGLTMYSVNGMLEKNPGIRKLGQGEFLFPEAVKNHRLYIKDSLGKSLGYLSFKDNRLYYVLVPLFEERKVQIMIMQNAENYGRNNTDLCVWIKMLPLNITSPGIDYNFKIRRLIDLYANQ